MGTRSMPTSPGQARASALRASRSNRPSAAWAITAFGMPLWRIRLVSARVSMPASAVARRRGNGRMQDDAARPGRRSETDGLDVLLVRAHIADMRKREGDDLARIGRVGEDFLVARHGGIEADLADRVPGGAKAVAL